MAGDRLDNAIDLTDRAPDRDDPAHSTALRDLLAATFAARTMAEWSEVFAGTDACVTPVLTWAEAARDAHLTGRSTVITARGFHPRRFAVSNPASRLAGDMLQVSGTTST